MYPKACFVVSLKRETPTFILKNPLLSTLKKLMGTGKGSFPKQ